MRKKNRLKSLFEYGEKSAKIENKWNTKILQKWQTTPEKIRENDTSQTLKNIKTISWKWPISNFHDFKNRQKSKPFSRKIHENDKTKQNQKPIKNPRN